MENLHWKDVHKIYTLGATYKDGAKMEVIPFKKIVEFGKRAKINLFLDLRNLKDGVDIAPIVQNYSMVLSKQNIHYFSFLNIFKQRLREMVSAGGVQIIKNINDESINKLFENIFNYIKFQCHKEKGKKILVLFDSISPFGLKEVFSKEFRGKKEFSILHLLPHFQNEDSFLQLPDDDLVKKYNYSIGTFYDDQIKLFKQRQEEEFREHLYWDMKSREDMEYQRSETDDFNKAMDDETDGHWRWNID